jgi:transcriptional regulator with XRE-family HTH domain
VVASGKARAFARTVHFDIVDLQIIILN